MRWDHSAQFGKAQVTTRRHKAASSSDQEANQSSATSHTATNKDFKTLITYFSNDNNDEDE